jgi:putative salt-induced outer membrane protein
VFYRLLLPAYRDYVPSQGRFAEAGLAAKPYKPKGFWKMTQRTLFAGAAAVALLVAGAAQAQVTAPMETRPVDTRPALGGAQQAVGTGLGEEIEDIEIRTQRELARAEDEARFGTAAVAPGFQGSVALTGAGSWGNTDSADLGIAGRFTFGADPVNHSFALGVEYGESDDDRDRNRVLGVYDLTYDFTPQFYGFGIVRGQYDEFASTNEIDIFAGVGPGIRVINTEDVAWRVQAGPGYRYTKNVDTGDTEDEFAGIASSRFFYRVTSDMFLTNDTDVIYSDIDTLVSNDLALNTRLTGPLSARVSLRTDYSTDPAPGNRSTDNYLTLGVVYSFQ